MSVRRVLDAILGFLRDPNGEYTQPAITESYTPYSGPQSPAPWGAYGPAGQRVTLQTGASTVSRTVVTYVDVRVC